MSVQWSYPAFSHLGTVTSTELITFGGFVTIISFSLAFFHKSRSSCIVEVPNWFRDPNSNRNGCLGKWVLCTEDSLSSLLHPSYFCSILFKAHLNTPVSCPENIGKPPPQWSQNTAEIFWEKYPVGLITDNRYFQITSM